MAREAMNNLNVKIEEQLLSIMEELKKGRKSKNNNFYKELLFEDYC
jgi:hypothetical protein